MSAVCRASVFDSFGIEPCNSSFFSRKVHDWFDVFITCDAFKATFAPPLSSSKPEILLRIVEKRYLCLWTMCTRNKLEIIIFSSLYSFVCCPFFLFAFLSTIDTMLFIAFVYFSEKMPFDAVKNNNSHPTHLPDLNRQSFDHKFSQEPDDILRHQLWVTIPAQTKLKN